MIYGIRTWNQLGDSAIATGAVRNVKSAYPDLKFRYTGYAEALWENNPDVVDSAPDVELPLLRYAEDSEQGDEDERNAARGNVVEGCTRTLCSHLHISEVPIITRTPVLFLDDEEKELSERWEGRWLLNANCQYMSRSKGYPWWQEVVDSLKGEIPVVQIGSRDARNLSPDLTGVLDWRGKSENLRMFLSMVYGCAGVITPPSGIMNIGAAFGKKMVVVTGAREAVSLTGYPNTEYVGSECCGFGPCRGCMSQTFEKERPCRNPVVRRHQRYSRCMDMIKPGRVAEAVRRKL
ncbi:MAG: hypothetical protein J6Y62_02045 [Clostridia bacterium]|nr:hypothetical protein [Clostridia bacterium]